MRGAKAKACRRAMQTLRDEGLDPQLEAAVYARLKRSARGPKQVGTRVRLRPDGTEPLVDVARGLAADAARRRARAAVQQVMAAAR